MCTGAVSKRRAIPSIKHHARSRQGSSLQTKMLVKIQEDRGDTQDLGSITVADFYRAKGREKKKTWPENRVLIE
ncbi:hypothetical protein IMY05_007G0032000 [Salix suchowensis]|nr:hypothetical protein IMY05_007G0032000 [Salix suchowensis]